MGRAAPGEMPGVDPGLQVVAHRQQPPVLRREPSEDRGNAGPEGIGLEPGPRQGLGLDEGGQFPGDLKTGTRHHRHGALLGAGLKHSVMPSGKSSAFRNAHMGGG